MSVVISGIQFLMSSFIRTTLLQRMKCTIDKIDNIEVTTNEFLNLNFCGFDVATLRALDFFMRLCKRSCVSEQSSKFSAIETQYTSSYGCDIDGTVPNSHWKLSQKDWGLWKVSWRSFEWCSLSRIIPKFNLLIEWKMSCSSENFKCFLIFTLSSVEWTTFDRIR